MSLKRLESVSVRNLLRRKGRYVLTASGIALGVSVLFAVQIMSGATNEALDRALRGYAGDIDVFIGPAGSFDATLPPGQLDRVRAAPDVKVALPNANFRSAFAKPGVERGVDDRPLIGFVNGVDVVEDPKVRQYTLREGRMFAAGTDEAIIGNRLSESLGLAVGDQVLVAAPSGSFPLTVVGILRSEGAGTASNGDVAFTSISVTQRMLAKADGITGVAVVLNDGVDADAWIDAQRPVLGEELSFENAENADAGFRGFVAAVNGAMTLGAAIALFVGGFLIFLTFSLAVAERTRTYGTMRALGALPKQVRRVVVAEAAVLGVVSGLVGLVLGYGLAGLSLRLVQNLLDIVVPSLGLPVGPALFAMTVGVLISVVAAWLPGRRAAKLSPVAAMREGSVPDDKAGRPLIGGILVGVGMVAVFALPGGGQSRLIPTLMVLFGAVMLVPVALGPLARFLGAVTGRIAPGVGAIAVMHLVKQRSRSAYTLALVMVVLSMIFAIGTSNVSMSSTIDRVIERQAGGSIQVGAPGAFEPSVEAELAAIEGVERTSAVRFGLVDIAEENGPSRTFFTIFDPATYFEISSLPWVEGDDETVKEAFARGGAVALPEQTATLIDRKIGDEVKIRTSQGIRPFTLVATYAQIGNNTGPAFGLPDAALFGAARPHGFALKVGDGVDPEAVRRTILERLGTKYQMEVQTTAAIQEEAQAQLQGFFGLAYALLFVAAIVGVLGLANTMVVSVLSRTREIGILRSTGVTRRQARAMVLVEAATLALVAYVIAIPLGWLLSTGIVVSQRGALGFSIDYVFPFGLVPALLILSVFVAAIASLVPARRMGRLQIVEALRFD